MEIAGAFFNENWPFAGDFTGGGPNIYILKFLLGDRGCLCMCNLNAMVDASTGMKITSVVRRSDSNPDLGGEG